jgi:hypothetical protein
MKFINDWLFSFHYEYDDVFGKLYEELYLGNPVYVRIKQEEGKILGTVTRKDSKLILSSKEFNGVVLSSLDEWNMRVKDVTLGFYSEEVLEIEHISLTIPEPIHTLEDKVHRILTHSFGPAVRSNKTIFEELVRKTIGKYNWCFKSSDKGVQIISGKKFSIYEKFGVITEETEIPFRDSDYIDFLEQYVEQITDKVAPKVPKFMSKIEELVRQS